jgi:hypothetical protein
MQSTLHPCEEADALSASRRQRNLIFRSEHIRDYFSYDSFEKQSQDEQEIRYREFYVDLELGKGERKQVLNVRIFGYFFPRQWKARLVAFSSSRWVVHRLKIITCCYCDAPKVSNVIEATLVSLRYPTHASVSLSILRLSQRQMPTTEPQLPTAPLKPQHDRMGTTRDPRSLTL